MQTLKYTTIALVLFLIGDSIWIKVAGNFLKEQLTPIARMDNGNFSPRLGAAALVYILMAFAVEYFVFNPIAPTQLSGALTRGAFLGLVIFGVFDLTNRALLEQYPTKMAIVDICWGVFIFTTVSASLFHIRKMI